MWNICNPEEEKGYAADAGGQTGKLLQYGIGSTTQDVQAGWAGDV